MKRRRLIRGKRSLSPSRQSGVSEVAPLYGLDVSWTGSRSLDLSADRANFVNYPRLMHGGPPDGRSPFVSVTTSPIVRPESDVMPPWPASVARVYTSANIEPLPESGWAPRQIAVDGDETRGWIRSSPCGSQWECLVGVGDFVVHVHALAYPLTSLRLARVRDLRSYGGG